MYVFYLRVERSNLTLLFLQQGREQQYVAWLPLPLRFPLILWFSLDHPRPSCTRNRRSHNSVPEPSTLYERSRRTGRPVEGALTCLMLVVFIFNVFMEVHDPNYQDARCNDVRPNTEAQDPKVKPGFSVVLASPSSMKLRQTCRVNEAEKGALTDFYRHPLDQVLYLVS
jgi:hypothetical protein